MGLVKIGTATDWSSGAVLNKPEHCRLCALTAIGKSFVPDYIPEKPKIAFILDVPSKHAALDQNPLASNDIEKLFITDLGYKKEDVLVSHVIRCVQPLNVYGKVDYPKGYPKKQGEFNCRKYDNDGLTKFNPSLWLMSLHPRSIALVTCHYRQILRDVEKAFSFAEKGYRPAVLFGEDAAALYFPHLQGNGGIKTFRGHYWLGESPFRNEEKTQKSASRKLFVSGNYAKC